MARSELLAVLLVLSGCDLVVGLSGDPRPCGTTAFPAGKGTPIVAADDFSIDWDQTIAVLSLNGLTSEYRFGDKSQMPIDLGAYVNYGFALAPEGNGLFFTAQIEPPTLMAAGIEKAVWRTGQRAPRGTFAGTPSADTFGPRRVLVRISATAPSVQEFEDQDGVWVAVGDPHDVSSVTAPRLTPNGLTMVYADTDGIHEATRASVNEWFGTPALVLAGAYRSPQLLGKCSDLYVVDNQMLTRFER